MGKYYGKKQLEQRPKGRFSWAVLAILGALSLIIVGVIVLTRPGQATGAINEAGAGPRLGMDRDKLDFGKVKMDTPVTAAFKVRNEGNEPLQILGQPQVRVVEGC